MIPPPPSDTHILYCETKLKIKLKLKLKLNNKIERILTMVYNTQNDWGFGICPYRTRDKFQNPSKSVKIKNEIKHSVFWDVKTCGSCKNRRFGGT
jgi:hypothetical protein